MITKRWWFPLALIVLTAFVFLSSLTHEYFNFDDDTHLFKNALMLKPSFDSLWQFWSKPFFYLYIPSVYTIWLVLSEISVLAFSRLEPLLFHCLNLITHLANTYLVFELLNLFLNSQHEVKKKKNIELDPSKSQIVYWASFAGALLFFLHPVQVESIAWISCFKDLSFTFFALLCMKNFWLNKKPQSSIFFLLAVLSKPTAVLLPFILVALDRTRRSAQKAGSSWVKELFAFWPGLVMGIAITLLTKSQQPNERIAWITPLMERPFLAGHALVLYLSKIVFPLNLAPDYGISSQLAHQSSWFYLSWLLPSALLVLAYRGSKWVFFACFFIGITLAPTLGLIPFEFQNFSIYSDHYLYLPMLGVSLLFALAFESLYPLRKNLVVAGTALLLLAFSLLSFQQVGFWKNSETMLMHNVQLFPNSYLSHYGLGSTLLAEDKPEESLKEFFAAYQLLDTVAAQESISIVYLKLGKSAEAEAFLLKKNTEVITSDAVPPRPDLARLRNNLAVALYNQGKTSQAIEQLKIALHYDPNSLDAHHNLSRIAK